MQTVLDQAHLAPLPISVRPVLWDYDHALRLYPMPTTVSKADPPPPRRRHHHSQKSRPTNERFDPQLVLADSFEPYKLVYERCLVFNPGSFQRKRFGWSTYHPHMVEIRDRMEERCALEILESSTTPLTAAKLLLIVVSFREWMIKEPIDCPVASGWAQRVATFLPPVARRFCSAKAEFSMTSTTKEPGGGDNYTMSIERGRV